MGQRLRKNTAIFLIKKDFSYIFMPNVRLIMLILQRINDFSNRCRSALKSNIIVSQYIWADGIYESDH
ncbi:MAG TPA: hypothetical protein DGB85_10235, partial [Deltaproteobacteria bacterium]|nr:hypothetical protein [Deltaproteobacteria bacterium]